MARFGVYASGIVKLTQKNSRACNKERTIEGLGLSRAPVFSLFSPPQLSSRGRRLGAIFHYLDNARLPDERLCLNNLTKPVNLYGRRQAPPIAGATKKRRLLAVACQRSIS